VAVTPEYNRTLEYNAVESAEELAELVRRNEDTSKVTQNATNLMTRHIDAPWSQFVSQCDQNYRI
jgi:hypothetical protein